MMHMSFWFDTNLGSFLFSGYDVSTLWGFLATCFGLFSLAIVYEAMKVLQIKLHKRTVSSLRSGRSDSLENSSLLTQNATETASTSKANRIQWSRWIAEILHWTVHTTLGYVLMLAVMSYNAYLCIALIIGASFGYWIFGTTLVEMNLEQYRMARNKILRCDPQCADAVENEERRDPDPSNISGELITEVNAEIHAATSTSN